MDGSNIMLNMMSSARGPTMLSAFPVSTQREVCGSIISALLTSSANTSTLTRMPHVQWTLDIVGQSFRLPMDNRFDSMSVSGALQLFRCWIGLKPIITIEDKFVSVSTDGKFLHVRSPSIGVADSAHGSPMPQKSETSGWNWLWQKEDRVKSPDGNTFSVPTPARPHGMEANTQHYLRDMIQHMSFLFNSQNIDTLSEEQRESLLNLRVCALLTYRDVCSQKSDVQLEQETWELLLRLTLEISSALPEKDRSRSHSAYAQKMCAAAIATVIEVWLQSIGSVLVDDLWHLFTKQMTLAVARSSVAIEQWHACCVSITSGLVEVLWERHADDSVETQHSVCIHWPHAMQGPTKLTFTAPQLVFAWQNMYHLMQKPSLLSDPHLSKCITRVVADIVRIFVVYSASNKVRFVDPVKANILVSVDKVLFIGRRMLELREATATRANMPNSFESGGRKGGAKRQLPNIAIFAKEDSTGSIPGIMGSNPSQKSADVVNIDLHKGNSDDYILPATTEGILNLFGNWLFDACEDMRPEAMDSRADALQSLCKTICFDGARTQEISASNRIRFFNTIKNCLLDGHPALVSAILISGHRIFACGISGVRCLINYFLPHLVSLLDPNATSWGASFGGVPHADLRSRAIYVIGSFIGLPNQFKPIEQRGLFYTKQTDHPTSRFATKRPQNDQEVDSLSPEVKPPRHSHSRTGDIAERHTDRALLTYDLLRKKSGALLVSIIENEKNTQNICSSLWTLCVKVLEDAKLPGIAQIVISVVTQQIIRTDVNSWWGQNMPYAQICALQVLAHLSHVHKEIQLAGTATIPKMILIIGGWAMQLVRRVRVDKHSGMSTPKTRNGNAFNGNSNSGKFPNHWPSALTLDCAAELASTAIETLMSWCLAAPWILGNSECGRELVSLAITAADEVNKSTQSTNDCDATIRLAGSRLLHILLRDIARDESGGGKLPAGLVAVAALLGEDDAMQLIEDSFQQSMSSAEVQKYLSVFALPQQQSIVTLVELPLQQSSDNRVSKQNGSVDGNINFFDRWRQGAVSIIVRDGYGKYAWTAYRQLKRNNTDMPDKVLAKRQTKKRLQDDMKIDISATDLHESSNVEATSNDPLLQADFEYCLHDSTDKVQKIKDSGGGSAKQRTSSSIHLIKLFESHCISEDKNSHISKHNNCSPPNIAPCHTTNPTSHSTNFFNSRALMAHVGLLCPESCSDIVALNLTPKLLHSLRQLDQISSRDCMDIDITYIRLKVSPRGKRHAKSTVATHQICLIDEEAVACSVSEIDTDNSYTSLVEFYVFLSSLGWPSKKYIPPDLSSNVKTHSGHHRIIGSKRLGSKESSLGPRIEYGENILQHTDYSHVLNIFVPCWSFLEANLEKIKSGQSGGKKWHLHAESIEAGLKNRCVNVKMAKVHVVWNDSMCRFTPNTEAWSCLGVHSADMTVIVDPLPDQRSLCAIRIILSEKLKRSSKMSAWSSHNEMSDLNNIVLGPLLDGMIVRLNLLPTLVRQTAINLYKHLESTEIVLRRRRSRTQSAEPQQSHLKQTKDRMRKSRGTSFGELFTSTGNKVQKLSGNDNHSPPESSRKRGVTVNIMTDFFAKKADPHQSRKNMIQHISSKHALDMDKETVAVNLQQQF